MWLFSAVLLSSADPLQAGCAHRKLGPGKLSVFQKEYLALNQQLPESCLLLSLSHFLLSFPACSYISFSYPALAFYLLGVVWDECL